MTRRVSQSAGHPQTTRPHEDLPLFKESLGEKLRCAVITKLCTDAYSPDVPLINKCIQDSNCKLPPKK